MQVVAEVARPVAGVPVRSIEQRMEALERANQIRVFRARRKEQIAARERSVTEVLLDVPAEMETMKVIDLLLAVPKVGRVKADKILRAGQISPSKTLGGLTVRQRDWLVRALAPYSWGAGR